MVKPIADDEAGERDAKVVGKWLKLSSSYVLDVKCDFCKNAVFKAWRLILSVAIHKLMC